MSNLAFVFCFALLAGVPVVIVYALVTHHRRKQMREVAFSEIIPLLMPANLPALLEMTNPYQENYLRGHLTRSEFRRVQRRRIRVLIEITKRILSNTALVQDLGAGQLYTRNNLMAELGEELVDAGARVRMYALLVLLRLYGRKLTLALGPFAFSPEFADLQHAVSFDLVPAYQLLKNKAAEFTLLRSAGFVEPLLQNL
jgi:hypothetical protein